MTKLFLALSALALATPAYAAQEKVEVRIAVQDLNLSTPEGRAELNNRARKAAIDNCGIASPSDRQGRNIVKECRDEVMAKAARAGAAAGHMQAHR